MSSRPAFASSPSDYTTLTTGSNASRATLFKDADDLGSSASLTALARSGDGVFELSDSASRRRESRAGGGQQRYGEGGPAAKLRANWRRPRVLVPLLVAVVLVVVLAIALPVGLHQHRLSHLAATAPAAVPVSFASATSIASAASSSAPTASSPSPAPTPLTADEEFALIKQRRRTGFAQGIDAWRSEAVPGWMASQKVDGSWPDVDYTSGCAARRANWPAQEHLQRTLALAAMQSGLGKNATGSTATEDVRASALKALAWWISADFGSNVDCVARGGDPSHGCGCHVRGLWNSNWFGQAILVPRLVSSICLLMYDHLTEAQKGPCDVIVRRGYNLDRKVVPGLGPQSGANLINIMQNFVSLALYTDNDGLLADALRRAMSTVTFSDGVQQDGIHRDGSFLQHSGLLYNGNYGKDLLLAFIELEGQITGTRYAADEATRAAFATDIRGSEWMIHGDVETGTEFWDLHVLGRFVAFPTSELTASADINFNVSKLQVAAEPFTGDNDLSDTIARLSSNGTMTSANVGNLSGNKGFWASDYMVHRRESYVQALKLLSTRSLNTEAINGANPFGMHIGIGSLFTYASGSEYRDIQGAWDWNLIPGSTTLLNRPSLDTQHAQLHGVKAFVGVVSDGWDGLAVMDFAGAASNPQIAYRKAFFFLDDVVVITTSSINARADMASTPVVAVLDNRRLSSDKLILIDDAPQTVPASGLSVEGSTLWHDNTGYLSYSTPFNLTLSAGDRSGNWSKIATTSAGVQTVALFSAYTSIARELPSYSYAVFPASDQARVKDEAASPTFTPLNLGKDVSAVAGAGRLGVVFWSGGQTVRISLADLEWPAAAGSTDTLVLTSSSPAAFLLSLEDPQTSITLALADPTQIIARLDVTLSIDGAGRGFSCGAADECSVDDNGALTISALLPTDGLAGSTVLKMLDLI